MPADTKTISIRLFNQSEFMEALKAALSEEVLRVRLSEPPPAKETLTLEITGRTERVVVAAEVHGALSEGAYSLRLRPRSDEQFAELFALIAKLEEERRTSKAHESKDALDAELEVLATSELEELGEAERDELLELESALTTQGPHDDRAEDTMTPVVRPAFGNKAGTFVLPMPAATEERDAPPSTRNGRESSLDVNEGPGSEPRIDLDDNTIERNRKAAEALVPDPLLGRKVAGGKYEIESLVGSGASGAVYKAQHIGLRRAVAIKVLHPHFQADPEFMKRFHREALAASQLDHTNIMRVLDFGQEEDGLVYIVMEFLSGASLQTRLNDEGKFTAERAVSVVSQVLSALAVAHEQGIIHRDVKPDNIVIVRGRDEDGGAIEVVKVCDFGIAALQNTHPDDPTPRQMAASELALSIGGGYLCGTPEYMAPEQARGETADVRSDIYACACTLYELLTGQTPFQGMSPMDIIHAQTSAAPKAPSRLVPTLGRELEAVIMKALSKAPEERQQTARQLRTELREALEAAAPKAQKRAPLEDRTAGSQPAFDADATLSAFVTFFASAVLGTGAFRAENASTFAAQFREGQKLCASLTETRREITFVRRDTEKSVGFFALSGDGEGVDLKKLFGREGYEKMGAAFVTELARPGIAALTLHRELTDASLSELVLALRKTPEDAARAVASGRLAGVSAIFPNEIVGRDRKLSWKVGLSASRLARDLALVQRGGIQNAQNDATRELVLRTVRVLTKAEELRQLLVNIDLAGARGARAEGIAPQIAGALPLARCVDVTSLLVSDLEQKEGPERERSMALLPLFARRIVRERTPEMFELLCDLGVRGIIPLAELPDDIALVLRAEQLAATLSRSPDKYLAKLMTVEDPNALQTEMTVLKGALKVLARRGEATALLSAVTTLARIASSKGQSGGIRERLALKVITSVIAEDRLVPVANVLMLGQPHVREAAKQLLVLAGEGGARALIRARAALREPTGRPHFVEALKETGAHGSAVVAKTLAHIDLVKDGLDVTLVEDILRGVPARPDSALATEIGRFLRHRAFRGAALLAFVEVSGERAREFVVESLEHADESVRAAAYAASAKMGAVDDAVVTSIEKLFARPGAGEPVRRAAVTALASAKGAPRGRAMALLGRIVEGKSGLLSMLRAGEPQIEEPLVVLDAARSLLALDRSEGIRAIVARRPRASKELGDRLEQLVDATSPKRIAPPKPS